MDDKKSTAISITALLSIFLFAIIGSCFMGYMYEREKVQVSNPKIYAPATATITSEAGENIDELQFSEIKPGLKPVTGELDQQTKVPVTVNDQNGSEGIYAKFKITTTSALSVKIENLKITGNDKLDIQKERANIWLAIMEIADSSKNLEEESVTLGTIAVSQEPKVYTLLFWLASVASEEFESTTISFDVILN